MGEKTTGKKKISIRNRFRSFRGYKEKVSGTPYDDAFRTLLVKCPSLLIPMVNEAFGTHYDGTEKVILFQNEHFVHQKDGSPRKRITDSCFSIKAASPNTAVPPNAEPDGEVPKYIMECQTNSDGSFLTTGRLSTYDFCIITDLLKLVSDNVAKKYKNVRKGVEAVMGGNVIETPSSIAYDIAMKKGVKKGLKIGVKKGERRAYYQMVQDGDISIARAAKKLGMSEKKVRDNMILLGFQLPPTPTEF